jgi:hypothetical protein
MKYVASTLILVAAALSTVYLRAGGPCCCHCGCESSCRKVCRVVCEMKEVTKVTYDCKCEDICIPGPSSRERVCNCGHCDACCQKSWQWTPSCATVKTRQVPVRKEEKLKKPTYKWVVEYVCDRCAAGAEGAQRK